MKTEQLIIIYQQVVELHTSNTQNNHEIARMTMKIITILMMIIITIFLAIIAVVTIIVI